MNTVRYEKPMEELLPLILDSFQQGMTVTLGVTGNSMAPLLRHHRDSVVLAPCDSYALRRGDLPLYRRSSGQFVLHRIIKVAKDTYTMCGDAQVMPEAGVPKEKVLAQVVSLVRKGKTISCTSPGYRLYVQFWMAVRPLRFFWSRVRGKLFSVKHRLFSPKRKA